MNLNCLIVDDEQLARDMLESYLNLIAETKVIGKCKNSEEAVSFLNNRTVDLILLDIHMPGVSGIEFLKRLSKPPMAIFTTAFSSYAIESYELEVVDYLLKPIGFGRFQKAIQKAQKNVDRLQVFKSFETNLRFEEEFLLVQEGYNRHKLYLKDILYIQAMREYVTYHLMDGKLMELKSLSSLESDLPNTHFIRIHRSYIVSRSSINSHLNNRLILKDKTILPIGKTYKQRILPQLF